VPNGKLVVWKKNVVITSGIIREQRQSNGFNNDEKANKLLFKMQH
jgi:hypothetical protein